MKLVGLSPAYRMSDGLFALNHICGDNIGYLNYTDLHHDYNHYKKLLEETTDIELLVVDASVDPWDPYEALNQIGLITPTRAIILTADPTFFNSNLHSIKYFPMFLLSTSVQRFYGHTNPRKYLASCLNRITKVERVVNLIELNKQPWRESVYVTFHDCSYDEGMPKFWQDHLTPDERVLLPELRLPINPDPNEYNIGKQHQTNMAAYNNSYLSIVLETSVDQSFISEKSIKPIVAKQFFTVIGHRGIVNDLREHGVDMFYDFIDHDYYEYEPDWRVRIKKMYEVLSPVMTFEMLSSATVKYADRLQKNIDHLRGDQLFDKIMIQLRDITT